MWKTFDYKNKTQEQRSEVMIYGVYSSSFNSDALWTAELRGRFARQVKQGTAFRTLKESIVQVNKWLSGGDFPHLYVPHEVCSDLICVSDLKRIDDIITITNFTNESLLRAELKEHTTA